MENNTVEVTRRNLKCEMNVLKNPDGSALLSQGGV